MIVNTPYGIGILKKKKIQTLNNNYYIKNIDYTIINEENNTFPISQEIMKIIKPDIKIQIKN
jgi:2C-methyl-D-erythritol 2,4-cyclodiphosphate synthase